VALLWQQVLNVDRIGRDDNFFNVGGSSLKAIQMIAKIYRELDVQLTIAQLFANPLLTQLAELINSAKRDAFRPIPKADEQESYPLSNSQKRVWVLSQLEGQSVAYNISSLYKIDGVLNIPALKESFSRLAERHESIRTVFILNEDEPRQRVLPVDESKTGLVIHDFRAAKSAAYVHAEAIAQQAFDLEQGPLFRVELLQLSNEEYLLVCSIHHIISDEWSMQVMVKEVIGMYNALTANTATDIPALPIQYRDYAIWQRELLKEQSAHRQYWLSKFAGELPVLDLPADRRRPPVMQHRGSKVRFQFATAQSTAFQQLLQKQQATPFMGAIGLVNLLLFRYTGQSDIIVGTPVAGREHPDLEDQIGYYLNTLVLRNEILAEESFVQVLEHIRRSTVEAFSHQVYPFDLLVEELNLRRDLSRSPLFDVMVVWQTNNQDSSPELSFTGVQTERLLMKDTVSKFDLTFFFEQDIHGLQLQIEYNTDLYDRERIESMTSHLQGLLDVLLQQPATAVASLDYLPAKEKEQVLHTFNDTQVNWHPDNMNLVSCFEQQVALHPGQTALISDNITLSYKELNSRANQVADWLLTFQGVGNNELIGISTHRNEYLAIGILGILKAGAAYVPIDPAYPADRVEYIINDSQLRLLLNDEQLQELFTSEKDYTKDNNPIVPQPTDLAYVIYTSGSTGNPKGVMIQHSAAINYIYWANDYYFQKDHSYTFPVFTSISFDLTITSLLTGFYRGDSVRLYAQTDLVTSLETMLSQRTFNSLKITPAHIEVLNAIEGDLNQLEVIIVGGEELTTAHVETLKIKTSKDVKIFNEYGPTEATVGCVVAPVTDVTKAHLIGKPIANTQIYILDEYLQPQPVGIPGELCIAGDSVAQGYLNNDALTNEKFVTNNYGRGKLYRTGDIARWNSDGNIEFFGRKDNQVKIRGYRIELGEIEGCLLASGLVTQAVVVVVKTGTEKSLAAYYTPDVAPANLREYLQGKLPHYMVPAYFIQLDKLPLTSNGKIDRNALPVPHIQPRNYKPAVTATEKAIARIWEEILNKQVSLDDNFFDIGGHSLKVIQVISRIYKELQFKISFSTFMQNPTISDLAELFTRPDTKSAIIMELGTIETGKPDLFLFSPLIGTPVIYKKLCDSLSTQYNCYGIQDAGFDDAEKADKSLSDKVDLFTKNILQQTTEKKISLLGFSFGATVAFEVAKQLEQKGMEISLIIIDRPVNKRRSLFNVRKNFVEQEDLNWFLDRIKTIDPGINVNWNNNIRLMENYKQKGRIHGQMIAFKSKENLNKDFLTMEDWKEYTSGNFSHYYFKGDHYACLEMQDNIDRIHDILTQKDKIKEVNY
jgi:amino acid adenylation domain-containing protein